MNVEEEKQEVTADDEGTSMEDEAEFHPGNVSLNKVGFGIPVNEHDPDLSSGSADRIAVAESGGSGTLLHEKIASAERGSSKWKDFLLKPKLGVRTESILEEKRAISSRSDRMRDSAKQKRLADLVAQSDNGSSSFLEEKQAIARRSYSVRGASSRQMENLNQVAGAAFVSISVLDEKRAIAKRSDVVRDSLKRRENQNRADGATDGLGNVLDDKLAIAATSVRVRKGSTERTGDGMLVENHAIAERGGGQTEAPIVANENNNEEESTNPTLNSSDEAGVTHSVENAHRDPQERLTAELQPGAYSVSASSTRALHGPGMLTPTKQTQSSRRNQSRNSDIAIAQDSGEFTSEDKTWWESVNKTALYVGGGCLLVVVILAVSLPLSLVERASAPTAAPTSPRLQFFDDIRSVVVNITGEQALENPSSPQSQALNWVVFDDTLALAADDPTLIQRFTLMTMYYANGGKGWRYSGVKWGSALSECHWDFVNCSAVNNVTDLYLGRVGMTGTLVGEMNQLSQLSALDLSNNPLSAPVFPTVLTEITALQFLTLNSVGMGGTLPDCVGNLTNLHSLIIPNNAFNGTLPATMQRLTNLWVATFFSNFFSGPLFDIVLNWTQLFRLDAALNQFNGTIPTELSRLEFLDIVSLNNNFFSGSLPSELGMLTNMNSFDWDTVINGHGSIPSELRSWSNLGKSSYPIP